MGQVADTHQTGLNPGSGMEKRRDPIIPSPIDSRSIMQYLRLRETK